MYSDQMIFSSLRECIHLSGTRAAGVNEKLLVNGNFDATVNSQNQHKRKYTPSSEEN